MIEYVNGTEIDWNALNNEAKSRMYSGMKANETAAFFCGDDFALEDKALFVAWLGALLSMTREEVTECYLADKDTLVIRWKGGYEKLVNIAADSRLAIIKDALNCGEF